MILMIYIEKSQGGITINTFVSQLPNEGALPAPENLKSIKEILDFQKKDTYKLSQGEVNEFFTVPKGPEKYSNSPISGGIHILFENQWFVSNKRYVGILVYFIALITLAVYGILAYYFTEYPALGYLNFFLIFTTDLALFFFLKANLSDGSFEPTLMAIVSRFCIFIWTGEYWFIGYSFYIIFQSLILFWNFVDVRFPLAAKAIKEDLTKKEQRDLTKTSEFVYLLIILMYILVIVLESLIQPEKIPYTRLTVDGFDYPL